MRLLRWWIWVSWWSTTSLRRCSISHSACSLARESLRRDRALRDSEWQGQQHSILSGVTSIAGTQSYNTQLLLWRQLWPTSQSIKLGPSDLKSIVNKHSNVKATASKSESVKTSALRLASSFTYYHFTLSFRPHISCRTGPCPGRRAEEGNKVSSLLQL